MKATQKKKSLYWITFEESPLPTVTVTKNKSAHEIICLTYASEYNGENHNRNCIRSQGSVEEGGDNAGHKLFSRWKCSHHSISVTSIVLLKYSHYKRESNIFPVHVRNSYLGGRITSLILNKALDAIRIVSRPDRFIPVPTKLQVWWVQFGPYGEEKIVCLCREANRDSSPQPTHHTYCATQRLQV